MNAQTIKVNSSKLDKLIDLVGELVTFNAPEAKRTFSETLNKLYSSLREAIKNFRIYSPDFYSNYDKIEQKIASLRNLSNKLDIEINNIKEFAEDNRLQKENHMNLHNLADSGIHNADIEEFLQHFTITDDKLEAGSIAGISVTGGAESGEITFF